MKKLTRQLSGIAGEYYVAAELSRRGYLAAITLRNSDGVDILISDLSGEKSFSIQVKTTQNKRKWMLTKKVEDDKSENKFYVFVNIPNDNNGQPEYFIIRAKYLSKHIQIGHADWLSKPGRNGKKRNDSNVRQFDPQYIPEKVLTFDKFIEKINNVC